jgi:hypothetical protein
MAIAIAATKNNLADRYGTLGSWFNCCTGNPGATTTPANEATGGGNARKQTTWGTAAAGVTTGTACIIDLAAGTYTYATLCSASSGATQVDNCTITSTTLSATGQIVLTPTFTIT